MQKRSPSRVNALIFGTALACALWGISSKTFAQDATAAIQGFVDHAPEGTVVTAIDNATQESVSVPLRSNGDYVIVGLRPGDYTLTFVAPDGTKQQKSTTLQVGDTVEVNSDFSTASPEIVVIGKNQSLKGPGVATNMSRTQIEALPQAGRNFMNFAALAPGITLSLDPERRTFQAGALGADYVNLFVDGQSYKNDVLQGGLIGQDSSHGNPFPQLAIQEYRVMTQNFAAEYDQAGSAIITAVTKTGGAKFHGSAFVNFQSKSMIGQPYYDRDKPKLDLSNREYGFELGGPIVRDRLHFYVTYEGREDTRPDGAVTMPDAASLNNAPLATALADAYNGSFSRDFKQDMVFGKLSWFASDEDRIDVTVMERHETDFRDFGGTVARSRASNLNQYVRAHTLKWTHRSGHRLNEFSIEHQDYSWRQSPLDESPAIVLVGNANALDSSRLAAFGGTPFSQAKGQRGWTIRNNLTVTDLYWLGRHRLKMGAKLSRFDYTATENDHANPEFYYLAATYVYGGTNVPLRARVTDHDPLLSQGNTQIGLFIQDEWVLESHWRINLGLRWDYESNAYNKNYETPTRIANEMRAHTGFGIAFNPEDYIANGHNRKPFMGAIQPRIGITYDVNDDQQTVWQLSFGRYYDRHLYDAVQLEERRAKVHITNIDFGATTPWDPSYFTDRKSLIALAEQKHQINEVVALNNSITPPYSDQFSVGLSQIFDDKTLTVTYSHITTHNQFSYVLGNRRPDGQWCVHGPQYGCAPWVFPLNSLGNLIVSDTSRQSRYDGLFVTLDRPYDRQSGYGYTATLTLSDPKSTGRQSLFFFDAATPNDTGWHGANGVSKMRFVASGIIDGPWNTRFSGLVTLASGAPFDLIDLTGPSPLAIADYYYPKKTVTYSSVDLKVTKDFELPSGHVVSLDLQVFNLFDSVNRVYSPNSGLNLSSGPNFQPDRRTQGYARSVQLGLRYRW